MSSVNLPFLKTASLEALVSFGNERCTPLTPNDTIEDYRKILINLYGHDGEEGQYMKVDLGRNKFGHARVDLTDTIEEIIQEPPHKVDNNDTAFTLEEAEALAGLPKVLFIERSPESQVEHPAHYGGDTQYETIKVIEAWELNFNIGNAVKYLSRAGKKGAKDTDLKKAIFYIQRELEFGK